MFNPEILIMSLRQAVQCHIYLAVALSSPHFRQSEGLTKVTKPVSKNLKQCKVRSFEVLLYTIKYLFLTHITI